MDRALAQAQQEAERRAGATPRTLAEILAGKPARPRPSAPPEDLTARQLRRRGRYGQAALLADQEALTERDQERARQAREASATLKALARPPVPDQFDLFGGNVIVGDTFHDTVRERLKASGATPAERMTAQAVLGEIIRWLGWQSYECQQNATEIAGRMDLAPAMVSKAIRRLEDIGAVKRIKRGQMKTIIVTPEGAYRGKIDNHAEVMDSYRAEVVPLPLARKSEPPHSGA